MIDGRREARRRPAAAGARPGGPDFGVLLGIAIASIAMVAGIALTGVNARYFFNPTGILIVIGGTLGVMLITTPPRALLFALQRAFGLLSAADYPDREDLIEEIVAYARVVRIKGILAMEPDIDRVSQSFLREALLLAMDTQERTELQSVLENRIRCGEARTEAAARVLEVAGGLTPTIGVLGTVVGFIDILRQFSNLTAIASSAGTAFTSTIYGLALANMVLLPAAYRIRSRGSETASLQELMKEGALCLYDALHPRLVRQRLTSFAMAVYTQDYSGLAFESARQTGPL